MSYKSALVGAGLALSLSMGGANANPVTVQLQEDGVNGDAITTVATGDGLANVAGLFVRNVYIRFCYWTAGDGYSALFSDVIGASSPTPGTLTIYVTLDGASLPQACPPGLPASADHRSYSKHVANGSFGVTRLGQWKKTFLSFIPSGSPQILASATFNSIDASQLITGCGINGALLLLLVLTAR